LAMVNTYLTNRNAVHRMDLVSNVTTDNPVAVKRISDYTAYFMQHGFGVFEAKQKALKVVDFVVTKQSNLMSYNDAYLMVGIVFLISLPLLLLARRRKAGVQVKVVLSDH